MSKPKPSKEEFEKLYETRSLVEMSYLLGVSVQTAHKWMHKLGVTPRPIGSNVHLRKPRSRGRYRDKEWLQQQYVELKQSINSIAKMEGAGPRTIWWWLHKHQIKSRSISEAGKLVENSGRFQGGANHRHWRGGIFHNQHSGYVHLWIDGKYVLEHRHVVAQSLGRLLRKNEVVHHINGIKDDNRLENLRLLLVKEHSPVLHLQEQLEYLKAENKRLHAALVVIEG